MDDLSSAELLYEVRDGIGHVTFNRPTARNALTFGMYERLAALCAEIDDDRSVRALVLTGAGGKAFAAGTDIALFQDFSGPEDALAYEARMERVIGRLESCRVPTVAAIAGACTGGGAVLAAACDLRLGAPNAVVGMPIARTLGNCLSAANLARLAALMGAARVKEMIFKAELMDASQALAAGFLNEIVPDGADLSDRAHQFAVMVAAQAPLTLHATKEGLRRLGAAAARVPDEDLILSCYGSDDFREGIAAFLAKRRPVWRGR
ncbi:MAG TPA: enoyl-CoA hydratase [Beijerinckiaceae bacterium]|jgi:enoyl-CoA hydratase/carnithine racemase